MLVARRSASPLLTAALLCLSASVQAERYTIPWFEPPGAGSDPQSVLRIVNAEADAATVTIHAIDDAGVRTGTAVLALNGSAVVDISAMELQIGDATKGLSSGVGNFSAGVRLAIESDVPIVPLALVRAGDGTLSALHDTVLPASVPGTAGYRYDVPIFHPASNVTQPSRLRLINPGDTAAPVTIDAWDDAGTAASGGTIQLTLPPSGAQTLTSQQLEAGDSAAFSGRLGAGVGNWRLSVSADRPIQVVNVAVGAGTGYWSNLSTTAVDGWAPQDAASFEARFLGRTIVSRDGQERTTIQVLADNGFLHTYMDDGVEIRQEAQYQYERTGRDAGLLRLDYDVDVNCEARFYFGSRYSGWYAFACVDREDRVEVWTGNTWLSLDAGAMPLDLGSGLDDRVYAAGTPIDTLMLPAASGGDGEFTYSLSPEVPGLRFDPQTRELTGTPSEAGVYLMTYRVRDASGDTDWRHFNIAVQAAGGETMTFGVGDTLSGLPTGSWTPDVTSNGTFLLSGGVATVSLDRGGYIEEGDYRYTCQSAGGCVIENRRVTSGTVVQTASGTAPGGSSNGGVSSAVSEFGLHDDNNSPLGIAHANGRLYVVNAEPDKKVYVYTVDGEHVPAADFHLHDNHREPDGIAYADGRLYVVDRFSDVEWDAKVYVYTVDGEHVPAADFDLHDDNHFPFGIAYANGRLYVVDREPDEKVYVYTVEGEHVPAAEFDLHNDNVTPVGIAHADGRLYVVNDNYPEVYVYTLDGEHVPEADFELHDEIVWPRGIAHADGRLYIVDRFDAKVYVYTVDGQSLGGDDSSPSFDAGSGPDNQTYTVGTAISELTLPAASGGDGSLTYSLSPEVPGLIFNTTASVRRLSGTPTTAGSYDMTYRVQDVDGDTDSLTFTITVEDPGGGGETTTYEVGDTLSDLPTGFWTPDVTSGGSFSSSGGNVTIRLNDGGYIEEGDYRFTCQSSGGCMIENRRVSSGTVARTSAGTAPGGGGEVSDDHGDDRASATRVDVGSDIPGNLSAGDVDYFRLDLDVSGTLEVYTSGGVDTVGQLEDSAGSPIDDNDDGGASTNFRIAADVAAGTYYARVRGFNNRTAGEYTLHVRFAKSSSTGNEPDLVVESASVSNSNPSAGASFTFSATVRNQGDGESGLTTLRYYRSTNATISRSDTQVGTDSVSSLSAGGTSAKSISLTAPSSAGTYYYGACVDSVAGESDTDNNCSAGVRVSVSSGETGGSGDGCVEVNDVVELGEGESCTITQALVDKYSLDRVSVNVGDRVTCSGGRVRLGGITSSSIYLNGLTVRCR